MKRTLFLFPLLFAALACSMKTPSAQNRAETPDTTATAIAQGTPPGDMPLSTPISTPAQPTAIELGAETPQSHVLSLDVLRNAAYRSPDWGEFKLADGTYHRSPPTAQESPDIYTTRLLDPVIYGDLNSDGFEDAVVFLSTQNGGTGHFVEMAAVLDLGGVPLNGSTLYLGDRIVIESGMTRGGLITLNLIVHGPNDGLCCPSQHVVWNFRLDNGQLLQIP
jgi:hypothetical protein